MEYLKSFSKVIKPLLHIFSRWKILSAYVIFSALVLSGWYIDIMGFFSSQKDYAGTFRAQHGDLNAYNIMAFLIGTIFYICLMMYDYLRLRLDKLQGESEVIRNSALFGDSNQAVTQNSNNSPAIAGSSGTTINYNIAGITEERCRAIFDEKWLIAVRDFSFESIDKAEERTKNFRTALLSRIGAEENGFESFSDPAFQFLLLDAQKAAATTERKSDYQVLSELLARRTKVGNDRRSQIHIKKAVEMLPFISDDALLGLTIDFLLVRTVPITGNISHGFKILDDTFRKVIGESKLPEGTKWIESLEACGLVKIAIGSFMSMNKSTIIMADKLKGYVLPGIKKDSDNYKKAVDLLTEVNLPTSILEEHKLDSGYVRLSIVSETQIDNMIMERELPEGLKLKIQFTDRQKEVLHDIFALYEQDTTTKEQFVKKLDAEIDKYLYLKKVKDWWDNINTVFQLNQTGIILANANANKYDSNVPIFEE